jgi:hypothetical protein
MSYTQGVPTVVRHSILSIQVCIPKEWTDEQAEAFAFGASDMHPVVMRRNGDSLLAGYPERNQCDELPGHVHVVFDL